MLRLFFAVFLLLADGRTRSSSELTSLFECPVCFDYALPPIYQCDSGHIICAECWTKVKICPTCRSAVGKKCSHANMYFVAFEKSVGIQNC